MKNLARVISYARHTPWAIEDEFGALVQSILVRRAAGVKLSKREIRAAIGDAKKVRAERLSAAQRMTGRSGGAVAVLPLIGVISHRAGAMDDVSGVTSAQDFARRFTATANDPQVRAIVLDVDSPGGSTDGIAEAAAAVRASPVPVVAVANTMAASAAYWIAAQADEIAVTPSGDVGSIGVAALHKDMSGALEKAGIDVSVFKAGKYKFEGHSFGPLDEEARAQFQSRVDSMYDLFVADVAKGRGVRVSEVRGGFGEGRLVDARQAVRLGMADRVATLSETVERLASGGRVKRRRRAEGVGPLIAMESCERTRDAYLAGLNAQGVTVNDVRTREAEPAARWGGTASDCEVCNGTTEGICVVPHEAADDPAPKQAETLPDDTRARIEAMRDLDSL